ncbi:hypothetical protein LINPERPRIM_LOCUS3837 [Linum perenne]
MHQPGIEPGSVPWQETHTSNPNEHKGVGTIEKQDDRDAAIWIGVCRGFVDEKQVGVWREKNIKVEAVGRLQVEVGEQQFADMVGDKKDEGLRGRDITCGLLQVKRYESNGVTFVFMTVKDHLSHKHCIPHSSQCTSRESNPETHTSNPNEHKGVGTIEKQDDRDAAIWIGVCRDFVDEKQVGVWREKNIKVEAVGRLQVEVGEQQFADMVGDKKDEDDCEGPPITQALHTSQLSMHQPGIEPGV